MKMPMMKPNKERGQAFVELAISLIFLLSLMTVMIDLGWAFYQMTAMRDAAQEAASYAAICPQYDGGTHYDPGTDSDVTYADYIRPRLKLSASAPLNMNDIQNTDITIDYLDPDGAILDPLTAIALGNSVRITFHINHKIIVPFAATFLGGNTNYDLSVNVSDVILRDDITTEDKCIP